VPRSNRLSYITTGTAWGAQFKENYRPRRGLFS
jgi:hypothetical protein